MKWYTVLQKIFIIIVIVPEKIFILTVIDRRIKNNRTNTSHLTSDTPNEEPVIGLF
jgi:hypothetical protein